MAKKMKIPHSIYKLKETKYKKSVGFDVSFTQDLNFEELIEK